MADGNIRFATGADAQAIADIYRPIVENTAISFELVPPTPDEIRARIENVTVKYPWLVCTLDDVVAGYVYGSTHRTRSAYQWSVEVTAYVHTDYRGRQVGRALYTALLAMLAAQGYASAFAGIALPNPASVRFHEALGFTSVGVFHNIGYKNGAWHDVGWWEKTLQTPDTPQPPRPLADCLGSDAFQKALADGLAVLR